MTVRRICGSIGAVIVTDALCVPSAYPKTAQSRTIRHDQYRETRERHAQQMASDTRKEQLRRRSWIAETPFAVIKSIMGVRQFLLRGRELVRHEWLWIGTAFNLKKLVGAIQRMRTKFAALIEMGLDQGRACSAITSPQGPILAPLSRFLTPTETSLSVLRLQSTQNLPIKPVRNLPPNQITPQPELNQQPASRSSMSSNASASSTSPTQPATKDTRLTKNKQAETHLRIFTEFSFQKQVTSGT